LSFTVFVFVFGPWPWPVQNQLTLYTFLFLAQAALLWGYLSGGKVESARTSYIGKLSSAQLLRLSVWLNIPWTILYHYLKLGPEGFSAAGIVAQVVAGAMDPGQAYVDKLDAPTHSTPILYVYMLLSPILWLAVPLGIASWRTLSLKMKTAIVFIVSAHCATWVALGTTKGIADYAAITAISIAATRRGPLRARKTLWKPGTLRRTAVLLCAVSALVLYFSYSHSSRNNGRINMVDKDAGIRLDMNNIFIAGLPTPIQIAVAKGSSYLSQGYYGLSLDLAEPFEWSYGAGHSTALTGIVKKLTDFDASELTYMARAQHGGWDMYEKWSSIYPWLASDLTFPGTLVLLFLLGRLLASVWADVQSGKNPYALPLFVMLTVGVFYFPANDQILSMNETLFAFWGLLYLWIRSRRTVERGRVSAWS
jgi:hypothetical protein